MPNFFDVQVTKGSFIFKEGDVAEKFYVITSGDFLVTKRSIHAGKEDCDNVKEIIADPRRHRVLNN